MFIIGIAGGTGSGKTTVVRKLTERLSKGEVVVIPLDSYYKDSSHIPMEERQFINFDHPDAFDWPLLEKHIRMLKEGQAIEQPTYSYLTCTRQPETIHIEPREVVIIEGIMTLCDKKLRQQMDAMKDKLLSGEIQQLTASAQEVRGLHVLSVLRNGISVPDLRKWGDLLRDKDPRVVGVMASENEGKISVLAVCGPNAVKQGVKAGVLVKTILSACGGSGGGKPDSAMGGCKDMALLQKELAKLPTLI